MDESEIVVGRIVRPHGLRGDLVVHPAANPDLFLEVAALTVDRRGTRARYRVLRARHQGKAIVVALEGIPDRTAAEGFVGADILVHRDELPPPGEDEVYVASLIGLPVVSPSGEPLGKVVEFEEGGVQNWLVVEANGRQSLVPFTEPLIKVELKAGRIVLDAPEGLLS